MIVVKSSVAVVKSSIAMAPPLSFDRSILLADDRHTSSTGHGGFSLIAADFNTDGRPDIAASFTVGRWPYFDSFYDVFLATGADSFSGPVSTGKISDCYGYGANTADFNGDGNLDLVFVFGGSTAECGGYYGTVLLGDGAGNFDWPGHIFYGGNSVSRAGVGDFNGDGKIDLVTDDDGGILISWGKGDGTFTTGPHLHCGYDVGDIAVLDFDNNGKLDIVHTCYSPDVVRAYSGNGSGAFSMTADITMLEDLVGISVGDFNTDGKMDLATSDYKGQVTLLIGNGFGDFFPQPSVTAVEGQAGNLVAADFDKDGNLDIAVTNWPNPNAVVSVLLGDGLGHLSAPLFFPLGPDTWLTYIQAIDFDNDGSIDLAVGTYKGVMILFNTSVTNQPPVAEAGPDKTFLVKETVPFDGSSSNDPDGDIDIYSWDFGDGSPAATGTLVSNAYAQPGQFTVTLTVTDNAGATAIDQLLVVVKAPTTAVSDLITEVKSSLVGEIQNSLGAKLDSALEALNKKNGPAAVNKLKAFINEVEAQKGKKIPADVAGQWIALVSRIIASI